MRCARSQEGKAMMKARDAGKGSGKVPERAGNEGKGGWSKRPGVRRLRYVVPWYRAFDRVAI